MQSLQLQDNAKCVYLLPQPVKSGKYTSLFEPFFYECIASYCDYILNQVQDGLLPAELATTAFHNMCVSHLKCNTELYTQDTRLSNIISILDAQTARS